jgi:regulatory protein YycH of two-component signal transduction system YycFG
MNKKFFRTFLLTFIYLVVCTILLYFIILKISNDIQAELKYCECETFYIITKNGTCFYVFNDTAMFVNCSN